MIDEVALFFGQGAATDAEVVQLAAIEFVLRHVELEAPRVVVGHQFARRALEQVFGLVGQ
ncbi:hypothetical protein D9M71_195010 [compost metagenome]